MGNIRLDGFDDHLTIDAVNTAVDVTQGTFTAWVYRSFADDTAETKRLLVLEADGNNLIQIRYLHTSDQWQFVYDVVASMRPQLFAADNRGM